MENPLFHLKNYLTYHLERFLIRGTHYRLLAIAALLTLISVAAGLLIVTLTSDFESTSDAIWWAFLRLTDPGYLGDDEGTTRRIISTVVTVLGYVLFMGSLVAIMTQWLDATLARLQRGETPISKQNHILILGWSERVPVLVREILLSSGRVKRFLQHFGESKLEIVILAEGDSAKHHSELRTMLGPLWSERKITVRSGTRLRLAHLSRVAFTRAAVIIAPESDFDSLEGLDQDTSVIKMLLTVSGARDQQKERPLPRAVIELSTSEQEETAKLAYRGELQTVVGQEFISRLIVQNIHHPHLSFLYAALLTHSDNQGIFIREVPEAVGRTVQEVEEGLKEALFLGFIRNVGAAFVPTLLPAQDERVQKGDKIIALSQSFESLSEIAFHQIEHSTSMLLPEPRVEPPRTQRILILGWSRKIPLILKELHSYEGREFDVTILSELETEKREEELSHVRSGKSIRLHHRVGDYSCKETLQQISLAEFDSIVVLSSRRLTSREDADARCLIGYLHLQALLMGEQKRPQVLIELLSPTNRTLIDPNFAEAIPSGLLVSHLLAQVSLRPELLSIYELLFGFGGAEIFLHPLRSYCPAESPSLSCCEIQEYASQKGEKMIGILQVRKNHHLLLNPTPATNFEINDEDQVVILSP
ncbi:hypothetical protein MRY87_00205 [bacterium]|nr:hypothetical protein [bacterium]